MSRVLRVAVGQRPVALRTLREGRGCDRVALAPLLSLRARETELAAAAAELREAARLLRDAAAAIPAQVDARLAAVAAESARFGIAVVAGVANGALDHGAVDPAQVVAHALQRAVDGSDAAVVEVRLHADDLAVVRGRWPDPDHAPPPLVADHELGRGEVRVVTTAGAFRYAVRDVVGEIVDRLVRRVGAETR